MNFAGEFSVNKPSADKSMISKSCKSKSPKGKWIFFLKQGFVVGCLMEKEHLIECHISPKEECFVGSIYVARVDQIVPGIKAAFLRIGERKCYLSLSDFPNLIYCKQAREEQITVGDEILVCIDKDAIKTKEPVAGGVLRISGRYGVVMYPSNGISFSRKIIDSVYREKMKKRLRHQLPEDMGILLRTNAKNVSDEEVIEEIIQMGEKLQRILEKRSFKTAGTCLWQPLPSYIRIVRDLNSRSIEEIVTDNKYLLENFSDSLNQYPETAEIPCRLYEDKLLSMEACYRIPVLLQRAMDKQVWLNSGAYLVIEQTEALTAIDVNTGKATTADEKNKTMEELIFSVNIEAAEEVMVQLRLRNLSGIIVVDFINMKETAHKEELLAQLRKLALLDPVKTTIVDLTPLGLVEITRKKEQETLKKQWDIMMSGK